MRAKERIIQSLVVLGYGVGVGCTTLPVATPNAFPVGTPDLGERNHGQTTNVDGTPEPVMGENALLTSTLNNIQLRSTIEHAFVATATARSPDLEMKLYETIPGEVIASSVEIFVHFGEYGNGYGTGFIVSVDYDNGVMWGFTASHVIYNGREPQSMQIIQPFTGQKHEYSVDERNFSLEHPDGIALFAVPLEEGKDFVGLGIENIALEHIPSPYGEYYSFSYPGFVNHDNSETTILPYPDIHHYEGGVYSLSNKRFVYPYSNMLSSGGSGAAVLNSGGKVIGVMLRTDFTNIYAVPFASDTYQRAEKLVSSVLEMSE